MISKEQYERARQRALVYFKEAKIALTPEEEQNIEVADFGLGELESIGLQLITYVNTDRCCAKELVVFPHQICPEHAHPPVVGEPGKEETFRCRWGTMYLYVPGEPAQSPKAKVPQGRESAFTVWHEVILQPGDQYTLEPETLHWFQGGPKGAIVSEFSTTSRDESDFFTDPEIKRLPEIQD